jgi:hypothetical protein
MKKFIFAFSLVLFMASLGMAITTEYQSGSSAQKAAKTVNGEVVSVDPAKNEMVVKDETGAEVRLLVSKSARVSKEGKPITLAEVKPSEKVSCEAEEAAGAWTARSIRVSSAKTDE